MHIIRLHLHYAPWGGCITVRPASLTILEKPNVLHVIRGCTIAGVPQGLFLKNQKREFKSSDLKSVDS
jgi:hypothetical protein